ncbi:hypothetical protein K7B09_12475, partial [Thermomonas sp. RSS23]
MQQRSLRLQQLLADHRVRSRAQAPAFRETWRPNSSFKPTPLHGREFFRYVAFPGRGRAAARLNSGVRRGKKQFALLLFVISHCFTASRLSDFALDRWL